MIIKIADILFFAKIKYKNYVLSLVLLDGKCRQRHTESREKFKLSIKKLMKPLVHAKSFYSSINIKKDCIILRKIKNRGSSATPVRQVKPVNFNPNATTEVSVLY